MNEDKFLIPPLIEESLILDYCGIHEVAFHLTRWPKGGYPDPTKSFFPKDYGCVFEKMFYDLENAIKYCRLPGWHSRAIEGVPFNVNLYKAILWALLNEYILPIDLQSAINLHQFDNSHWKRAERAVINKIVFQSIFMEDSSLSRLDDFLEHSWIKKYGKVKDYEVTEQKALKTHLFEAIGFKASRGNQVSKSKLSLKPIQEIMCRDNGHVSYHVKAFVTLIEIVCIIKLEKLSNNPNLFSKITPQGFMKGVIKCPVVIPYVKDASEMLLKVIEKICSRFVCEGLVEYVS